MKITLVFFGDRLLLQVVILVDTTNLSDKVKNEWTDTKPPYHFPS